METAVDQELITLLEDKATRLRIDSVVATTAAGSGHPTSCASCAEIVSTLFFVVMRYDPEDPGNPRNDVFVLSKGHAAPVLYAAWAEAGAIPSGELETLRQLHSDLEGHPTPRLPFVPVATGSLGQGLSVGLGIAIAMRMDHSPQRVYVLMGDGETAEGSVWEAAQLASQRRLDNLCATIDINRLGQSGPTMLQHELNVYKARWESFGWRAIIVDGHSVIELSDAYQQAAETRNQPTVVLARTHKGRDLNGLEDAENQHGKALKEEIATQVIAGLELRLRGTTCVWTPNFPDPAPAVHKRPMPISYGPPPYRVGGEPVAPRKAFGEALALIGAADPRVVVLDGDVKNSTFTEIFEESSPDRFIESYIAEQNMTGMAMGLASRCKVPVASTFACFFTRAYDFLRMAAISSSNIKLAGTHVGVSIGEDGPSQMGLEDLAMTCAEPNFKVLYPSDATSAWRALELAVRFHGPCYIRLGRPASPVLYGPEEPFTLGQCKILRQSDRDRALIVTGGVTVAEALAAHEKLSREGIPVCVIDLFSVQPIDQETLLAVAKEVGGVVVTVEDHYAHGGLGDAVLAALAGERVKLRKLAVREIPHSGKPVELLDRCGLTARHIVDAVKQQLKG